MKRASILLCLALAACDSPELPETPADPREPLYSPWLVDVDGELASFDVISFKDVGLRSVVPHEREEVYASIAQNLASELANDRSAPLESRVHYDALFSDPGQHLYCDSRHIYVDLWESSEPARVGYSLWSGCTDDHQFAWREIERERTTMASISALTRSIASTLREAVRTGCFTREC